MSNFNSVTLVGRLTADPETTTVQTNNGPVQKTSFRIAVNRIGRNKDTADFFDVETWRSTAEYVAAYQTKGKRVLVDGRLQLQQWQNDAGENRSKVVVIGDTVQGFDRDASDADGTERPKAAAAATTSGDDTEDIPF
jgi:single-strand DNA-binding protein